MKIVKYVAPLVLLALALAAQTGFSTQVNLTQLPAGIGTGTTPPATTSNGPKIASFIVSASTPNSFTCPTGSSPYIVTRNIAQSLGIDYNVTNGAVVFVQTPQANDVVSLYCW